MFEWDDGKNARNVAKHGIGFERARRIFDGPVLTVEDTRRDYGERRFLSIGKLDSETYLCLCHTPRSGVTRIISARPAKRAERARYDQEAV